MTVTLERGGVLMDNGCNLGRVSMEPVMARKVVGESKKGKALIRTEPEDFVGQVRLVLRKEVTAGQVSEIANLITEENVRDTLLGSMCVQEGEE